LSQLEQVLDGCVEIVGIERALLEAGRFLVLEQLDVEFQAAYAREIVFARVEEHALEQCGCRIERGRIAGAELAVDLDQRFRRSRDRIAAQRLADDRAHVVALGEENIHFNDARFENLRELVGRDFGVGFEQNFAGGCVDDVACGPRAFEVGGIDFDFADLRLLNFFQNGMADLAAGVRHFIARLRLDAVRQLHANEIRRLVGCRIERPEELVVANHEAVGGVEGLENVFAGAQAKGAQENRAQEFALAVDAHVEHVLLVVFEFDPGSAIGNDFAEEVRAVVRGLKEHARRAVQLADDNALGAVDDEGAVLRHQRNVSEEDFLLFDVADGAGAGLGVLVPDGKPHGDLERSVIGHAALLALGHVVLQLQADWIAALVAEVGRIRVVRAAVVASGTEVVQAFQVSALALPVADGVVDELELRDVAEVGNRKHRLKHRLQSAIFALARQLVHLQKAFVGTLLNLDQVRNLDGRWNFGKIKTLAVDIMLCHSKKLLLSGSLGAANTARNVARKRRAQK